MLGIEVLQLLFRLEFTAQSLPSSMGKSNCRHWGDVIVAEQSVREIRAAFLPIHDSLSDVELVYLGDQFATEAERQPGLRPQEYRVQMVIDKYIEATAELRVLLGLVGGGADDRNEARAKRGAKVLAAYQGLLREDLDEGSLLGDLLVDLIHYSHGEGIAWAGVADLAADHFRDEILFGE